MAQLESVSDSLGALVQKLDEDHRVSWQAAFTQYNMECEYVPLNYCQAMSKDGVIACQICDTVCSSVATECN